MCIKNRKVSIAFLNLLWLLFSTNSHAEVGTTSIKMQATLVAGGCTVSIASQKLMVNMGQWFKRQVSANSEVSKPVLFAINLEHCSSITGVTVTFNGQADSADPSLLAISGVGSAKNIGIAILDKDRRRIPLGHPSDVYTVSPDAESITLNFYGQYIASGEVSAGVANADATFSIEYP